ncbi:MAG: hypothetical protein JWR26_2467 [Pedosphaera sp.]|nr:hypothetical protein [Pedosphaera sp.]
MPVEFGEGKGEGLGAALVKERQSKLVLGGEVVQGDVGKVGNDDETGQFLFAALIDKVLQVAEGLGLGAAEIAAEAFVLDDEVAGPEEVDEAVGAFDEFYGGFEGGDEAPVVAEDLEEFVPEGLFFAFLAGFAGPGFGEGDGPVAYFVPGERHIFGMRIIGRG